MLNLKKDWNLLVKFFLLKMIDLIRSIWPFNPKINHYDFLYHDNVHLNFSHGIHFLKNRPLAVVILINSPTGAIK